MRYLNYLLALLMATLLAACGGGGGSSGTSSGGGGGSTPTPAETVAAIELLSSSATLSSASANSVTLTALVKNAANNGVASVAVAFAASSGVLQSVTATTDASGTATATLAPGSDRSNRDITVTVTAGGKTQTLTVPVVGTTVSVAGAGSILLAGQTTYSVAVRDSGGAAIGGVPVTVASSLGNAVTPATLTTDGTGAASFNYTATRSGDDVLTVGSAGAKSTFNVAVSSVDFAVVSPTPGLEVLVNTPQLVTVRYLSGGVGVAGQVVNFSSTRGGVNAAIAVTDAQGLASTSVVSTTAGPATVTAQIAGGAQTSVALNFIAADPATIVLQINPGAIPPNPAGAQPSNRAQLSAVVRDASGNPVKGRTVNFTALADASGGRINTGIGVTDANGTVTDLFISGALTTAANGVRIQAAVANTAIADTAFLTVSNQSLFITIATSNTISNVTETTYSKPFAVQVNDANGAAVTNQVVTLSVFPTAYYKGSLAWNGTQWTYAAVPLGCPNEDVGVLQVDGSRFGARDGVLQPGEDTNGDGRLTPGLPGVISPASVTTDASGFASFNLLYGENIAPWALFEITARAVVAGTESRSVHNFLASPASSDVTNETVPPAGVTSPYGVSLQSCTDPN